MRAPLLAIVVGLASVSGSGCDGCRGSSEQPDAGVDAGPMTTDVYCEDLAPLPSGTCQVTAGDDTMVLKGTVLTPSTVYHGGQVAVDNTGHVTCVACSCARGGETTIVCPDGAISPGLINTHDHITFTQNSPYTDSGERYEDRQQWRKGLDSHAKINSSGGASAAQIQWGELRFLMGGATSIVGSGGQLGLLRNLDIAADMEGLTKKPVNFDTFPLGDSSGTRRTADCDYGGTATTAASIAGDDAYEPHTSEGIDDTARNEFLCETSTTYDTGGTYVSNDLLLAKTTMIHGIGLVAADYGAMAAAGTGLIWSPRSNITLYGDTARVTVAARLGVNIALGTDWMPTGSMNLLRELKCADSFNTTYLDTYFSDEALWQMVTANAASATKTDDAIGVLAPGHYADISVFAAHHGKTFRAVIDAAPEDVALVMRAGKVLYGDDAVVTALAGGAACDTVDVCGTGKRVCLTSEVGKSYSALMTAAGAIYPAFACGEPTNEPSCKPTRPMSVAGSTVYTGNPTATDADGDGIDDATDACPHVFDPVRPLDGSKQGDGDTDGVGDACDPCPLDKNTTTCTIVDPNDRDHDGVQNTVDNCPDMANSDQADADADGKGDVCDACPDSANPGAEGCKETIYAIKMGQVPVGTAVRVTGALVTGRGTSGFFVQVKAGDAGYMGSDYSGLFVFAGTASPLLANATVGARVTIDGSVDSFGGETEVSGVTAVTVEAVGPEAAPAPVPATYAEVTTGGARAATLEGVLVSVGAGTVSAIDTMYGEFTLTSGPTNLIVDDTLFAQPGVTIGQSYTTATGVLATKPITGGSASKLEPRAASDLVAGSPGLASFGPALTYARAGTTANTIPSPLTVTLSGPAQGATTVMIMSGNTGALTVNNVIVPNGATSVAVPVTAIAQNADVTLTAMLGVQTMTAHVRVLAAGELPSTVTISPATAAVAPAGTVPFTVTLDIPAASATTINLAVIPAGAGTLPATVNIAANQISQTFTYTDIATSGSATVRATFGASTSNATVTVSTGASHLVINEVDYDQVMTDGTEFIEIYNPSASTISLVNKAIVLINGADNTAYATIDLGSAVSLASHGYLVIAGAMVNVVLPAKKIDPGWTTNAVQNGAPDGIALIDTMSLTVIDAFSYEGSITMAQLPGFATTSSLVEGTALPANVADSNTGDGSLCRSPNGQDTDNAATDWRFCTTPSAGIANP
jgi:cytosine/adenosine deaminase-related metal-dependent hydrolase